MNSSKFIELKQKELQAKEGTLTKEEVRKARKKTKKNNKKEIRKEFPHVVRITQEDRGNIADVHAWFVERSLKPYRTHGMSADYMPEKGYTIIRFKETSTATMFKLAFYRRGK